MSGKPAGKLIERVFIDSPVSGSDGQGGKETTWNEETSRAAGFDRIRGGETVIDNRIQGRVTTVVRLKAVGVARLINRDWRLRDARNRDKTPAAFVDGVWSGEIFNVKSRIETGDRQYVDLMCESGIPT